LNQEEKGKKKVREPFKSNSRLLRFKCQGFGHIATQCTNKTLIMETIEQEDDLEEEVYEPNLDDIVDIDDEGNEDPNRLVCIRTLPLYDELPKDRDDRLDTPVVSVVRCALAQPKDNDDWRRTTIFQTYVKSGTKDCRVIVDSGSCINAISSNIVSCLGLKSIPHPKPHKVS
jgi:hypothetical protein